jgi:putative membrane-bound dehydrogenase-like protein
MLKRPLPYPAVVLTLLALLPAARCDSASDLGLRVAPGFRVSLYADHELANDIYAMTLDSHGRVVVTSNGYIKTLYDTRGSGRADRATFFATPSQGGMGMCFDGNDLYFCGGGWFSRYRDSNGAGHADGPPEHLFPLAHAEHGGHAMRKGPDGWWYLIGGNDSGIDHRHVTLPHSPIRNPEAGALLRLTPDCRQCEVIAHGLRNPYDFDFNAAGDIFTYDSDVERDFFLPWYTPTRIYHVAYGGHHGWRLPSYLRSWCRRDFYVDTVDILWPVGRGSPTGVTCYRHTQFPEHYRGGLFALDWTFGKVYFVPLQPDGASYRTQPEVFLESVGTNGFDPTDIVVAPDGSLFISMGGRGTRGAVFHVVYAGNGETPKQPPSLNKELDAVLYAPQPLDAWSRARWTPIARRLGASPFAAAVDDKTYSATARVRAVEILTELFGGVPATTAAEAVQSHSPLVRARIAWSLGRQPGTNAISFLTRLTQDPDAAVRRCALESLADLFHMADPEQIGSIFKSNFEHSDKRVRQAAAHLATMLPEPAWRKLVYEQQRFQLQGQLTAALAARWRTPLRAGRPDYIGLERALGVLSRAQDRDLRLQAVRLLMLAFGDYHLQSPEVEVYTAYSLQNLPTTDGRIVSIRPRVLDAVRPIFPSGNAQLDQEASRLLAMLADYDDGLPAKVASMWSDNSSPTWDMHYLIVSSRLHLLAPHTSAVTAKVATTLLGLHRKLEGKEQREKQTWADRLTEVVQALLQYDPHLGDELLRHPNFVNPGHVTLALSLDADHRRQAARQFYEVVQKDKDFAWSDTLVTLLAELPRNELRPLLRSQWENLGLRDSILLHLMTPPEPIDRDKFLAGLNSTDTQIVRACLQALRQLPPESNGENLTPVLRLLRRLEQQPREHTLRAAVLELLSRQSGQRFAIQEKATDSSGLRRAYQPVFQWFEEQYPSLAGAFRRSGAEDPAAWRKLFASVDWSRGDAKRGEAVFRSRSCQTCHAGSRALGPDLTGVTNRFSRDDLFNAIIDPSRDVAPAYRTTVIETRNGQLSTGIIAFESADGVILQTGAATTLRIGTSDIVSRLPSDRSLMPDGLLKDCKAQDLADLYSYLQTLKPAR